MTQFTEYTIDVLVIATFIFFVGRFILAYLSGLYTYKDEIVSEQDFTQSTKNRYGGINENDYKKIIIKRTYDNGKIELIVKEV